MVSRWPRCACFWTVEENPFVQRENSDGKHSTQLGSCEAVVNLRWKRLSNPLQQVVFMTKTRAGPMMQKIRKAAGCYKSHKLTAWHVINTVFHSSPSALSCIYAVQRKQKGLWECWVCSCSSAKLWNITLTATFDIRTNQYTGVMNLRVRGIRNPHLQICNGFVINAHRFWNCAKAPSLPPCFITCITLLDLHCCCACLIILLFYTLCIPGLCFELLIFVFVLHVFTCQLWLLKLNGS